MKKIPLTVRFSWLVCLAPIILAACQAGMPALVETQPESAVQVSPTSPQPVPASPTPVQPGEGEASPPASFTPAAPGTAEISPQPEVASDRTRYDLKAVLDYYRRQVHIAAVITYPNRTGETLDHLLFLVDANRYTDAFHLNSLDWEDGSPVQAYSLEHDRLEITLDTPLQPGESLAVRFEYRLDMPAIPPPSDLYKPQPFGYTQRQLNLVDWYPYLPPYQDGWLANRPWFFGEHQVYEMADFRVEVEVSEPSADLVLAASSLPEQEGNRSTYTHLNARNFALSASHMYEVRYEQAGDVVVAGYSFPFDAQAAEAALKDTALAVDLYSELFGPYPHRSLTLVEADFLDGMEYDGLYFLSRGFYNIYDGTSMSYLTAIAVHETAHQWWYGLVGNNQAYEPWLDEALCTYSELLFYEHVYPDFIPWWWTYRVEYYEPTGWIDGSIYDYSGFRPYRDAVYLNGAVFLHELRGLVGEQVFFEFLKDYASRYAGGLANKQSFFDILAHHSDADILELTGRYFQSNR